MTFFLKHIRTGQSGLQNERSELVLIVHSHCGLVEACLRPGDRVHSTSVSGWRAKLTSQVHMGESGMKATATPYEVCP